MTVFEGWIDIEGCGPAHRRLVRFVTEVLAHLGPRIGGTSYRVAVQITQHDGELALSAFSDETVSGEEGKGVQCLAALQVQAVRPGLARCQGAANLDASPLGSVLLRIGKWEHWGFRWIKGSLDDGSGRVAERIAVQNLDRRSMAIQGTPLGLHLSGGQGGG